MKTFIFNCLVIIGAISVITALPAPTNSNDGLEKYYREIDLMIPSAEIHDLLKSYSESDPQVDLIDTYIHENALVLNLEAYKIPEVRAFLDWAMEHWHSTDGSNSGSSKIQHHEFTGKYSNPTGGFNGYLREFIKLYPTEEIHQYLKKESANSPLLTEAVQKLSNLKGAYEKYLQIPAIVEIYQGLQLLGVDTTIMDGFVRKLFHWE